MQGQAVRLALSAQLKAGNQAAPANSSPVLAPVM